MKAADGDHPSGAAAIPGTPPDIQPTPTTSDDSRALVHLRRMLGALLVAVVLYTCYIADSLILPVLTAVFVAVLLNPLVRLLGRLLLPRWLAALLLIVLGVAAISGLAAVLYEPAMDAARAAPNALREITPRLQRMTMPIEEATRVSEMLSEVETTEPNAPQRVRVVDGRPSMRDVLGRGARPVASVLTAVILVYFFLVFGETLLRRAVTLSPTLADKRVTVDIVRGVQSEMSRYMLTISVINALLGAATAALLWALDVPNPLLWGAVAGVLNFAPYVGPLMVTLCLGVVGLLSFDQPLPALMPAAGFLALNLVEGQFLTPMLLGRSLALNPVMILLWLMFWGWLWGIPGFLLGVPMLVCFKIVCSRVEGLRFWSALLDK